MSRSAIAVALALTIVFALGGCHRDSSATSSATKAPAFADAKITDLGKATAGSVAAMPEPLRRELRDLGLL